MFPANLPRTCSSIASRFPLDDPELRRAMAISIDHQAFLDILTLGQGDIGCGMQPPPEGMRGMPPEMLRTLRLRPRRGPEPRAGARNLPSDR